MPREKDPLEPIMGKVHHTYRKRIDELIVGERSSIGEVIMYLVDYYDGKIDQNQEDPENVGQPTEIIREPITSNSATLELAVSTEESISTKTSSIDLTELSQLTGQPLSLLSRLTPKHHEDLLFQALKKKSDVEANREKGLDKVEANRQIHVDAEKVRRYRQRQSGRGGSFEVSYGPYGGDVMDILGDR